MQIFSNLIANDYKSHVVVNRVVTFWLISTSVITVLMVLVSFHVFTFASTCLVLFIDGFPSLFIYIYTRLSRQIQNYGPLVSEVIGLIYR